MPESSIIIRTYNEAKHLPALFDALDRQNNRVFETIVIDSGSVDDTRSIALDRGAKLVRIGKHDFTFGYSLNAGIQESKGRFAVCVSAHTAPCDPGWLEHLVAPLRGDDIAMTYGRQLGVPSSKFSECEDFRRIFGTEALFLQPPDFFANNANSAVRRDLWTEHPFDESLTGLEDIEWAKHWMEKGFRVAYVPGAALYHIHEETWRQVNNRYYREAVAIRRIGIKGRRHVPGELVREAVWTVADLARAAGGAGNPTAERLSVPARWTEILRFRWHKATGIARGLTVPRPMETASERESLLFDKTGWAVRIHGPGLAQMEPVEIPRIRPGEVLIRVAHVAVGATDLAIADGTLGAYANKKASYPITPGHEFSGRIAAAGPNANHLSEGTPVVVDGIQGCGTCPECLAGNVIGCPERTELGVSGRDGAYAEYVAVPAKCVHVVPDGVDLRAAALCGPIAACLKGLTRLRPVVSAIRRNRHWGVVGAGPIGHIVARILEHRGERVTVFDRNTARLAPLAGSAVEVSEDLARLADCTVVVEATGNPEALERTLHGSPPGAAVLLLGLPYGRRDFSFETIAAYDKTVVGSIGSTARDVKDAVALLPALDLGALIRTTLPLQEFAAAWERTRKGEDLKIILDVIPPEDRRP